MNRKVVLGVIFACWLVTSLAQADFKYTESAKMTGGALAGLVKVMGHFSKQAKQANAPTVTTVYYKGDYMRRESAEEIEIIDLASQRIIHINTKTQTYYVQTFEQMRQLMEQLSQGLQQAKQQQKQQQQANSNGAQNVQMQMQIHVIPTNQTQQILGQTAQEMKIQADMVMSGNDPNHPEAGTQSGTMRMTIDSWVAPQVSGYQEVHDFNQRMAKEINWTPSNVPGSDPRFQKAMVDMAKSGKLPQGLPLLQTVDFGMAGTPGAANGAQPQSNTSSQSQNSQSSDQASSPQAEVAKKVLGRFGGFGGFGRKKKQQDNSDQTSNSNSAPPASSATPAGSGSLMQMTVQVTSFSTDAIDSSLFNIPAGYRELQTNMTMPH